MLNLDNKDFGGLIDDERDESMVCLDIVLFFVSEALTVVSLSNASSKYNQFIVDHFLVD